MEKIEIGLDYSILESLGNSQRLLAGELSSYQILLELLATEELIGYITRQTFQEIVNKIDRETKNQTTSHERATKFVEAYNLQIREPQTVNSFLENSTTELARFLSLYLEFELEVLIIKKPESLKPAIVNSPALFQKLWVLTPPGFLKLYKYQKNLEREKKIESDRGWQYAFKNISSGEELQQLHRFEEDVLPLNTNLDRSKLEEWWQTYNPGIKSLFLGSKLIAIVSIWSISEESAQCLRSRVRNGTFRENQLDVMPYQSGQICKFWYIGGVYLHEELRKTRGLSRGFLPDLLDKAILDWSARAMPGEKECFTPYLSDGVTIFAIPVNPMTRKMLVERGFQQEEGETQDGFPLFSRLFTNMAQLY